MVLTILNQGSNPARRKKYVPSDSESYRDTEKGSRYECMTCNKIFHSYQALGGHRASRTKVKGCFADVTPNPMVDSKLTKSLMSDS